ncbi:MAG: hypothetical protein KDJ69_16910 [Nitratireductor sp.]|nr:hypothetical protein [Nitratireductor sp.]
MADFSQERQRQTLEIDAALAESEPGRAMQRLYDQWRAVRNDALKAEAFAHGLIGALIAGRAAR